ncbi:MAG TPA: DUF192 domain-containing protein [Candidatus Bathyarchaeia archaeon]|nr:DUF192 domain-containing protein [Candidatus Bathyarchaeia archaeon]
MKTILVLVAIITGGALLWWRMNTDQSTLSLDRHRYFVSVMRTEDELERGLSGTDSLPTDHGMLFVFPSDNKWQMWMKDMKYPIDMVWLNDYEQVIYTVKDAEPSSYPHTFTPNDPARYVIELPSGTIDRTGIKNGDVAGFPSGV